MTPILHNLDNFQTVSGATYADAIDALAVFIPDGWVPILQPFYNSTLAVFILPIAKLGQNVLWPDYPVPRKIDQIKSISYADWADVYTDILTYIADDWVPYTEVLTDGSTYFSILMVKYARSNQ